jgi:hypothetical protein
VKTDTGSGFRFAAQRFAKMVADKDQAAMERHALASIENMATLEAIALSARKGAPVAVTLT